MYNFTITDLTTGNVLKDNPPDSLLFTQKVSLLLEPTKSNQTKFLTVRYEIKDKNNIKIEIGEEEAGVPITLDFKALDIRNFPSNSGTYTIIGTPVSERGLEEGIEKTINVNFDSQGSTDTEDEDENILIKTPFVAKIENIKGDTITINQSYLDYKNDIRPEDIYFPSTHTFTDIAVRQKVNDIRDLKTFLHFGDDDIRLVTNVKSDKETVQESPFSTVFKLYQPLPNTITEKDFVYVVKEILPEVNEVVELIPYEQEDEDVTVLRPVESSQVSSPVSKRQTDLQSYNDLISSDSRLQKDIVDKFISGSEKPVELNVEYSNYTNFVNFSSAEKRLSNFKYKLQQIETNTQKSSSLSGVTGNEKDLLRFDNLIRDSKNSFDGYENYLYNVSSSYVTSSLGEFQDASWPKTGSGTYADPYKPVSSSATSFTNWYGSVNTKAGQIYSASLYDTNNPNRLVNLLPTYIREDISNDYFLDFIDMIGQQFDELWLYTKSLSDITDRQNDLSEGFSKDLLFNLASSLGWTINDGKDLLDLSRFGFGQRLSGSSYSLYTSGSLDSPSEGDISKEITKRLISSMPYILKSKGTIGSLKAILNCYGIPSSILRVREYGGMKKREYQDEFEISRKFTKALGFRGAQYVETPWSNDSSTSRKPETIEFRFRAISGSDQVLVQKDEDWAIKLKNNGSSDNNGTVSFMLSGSNGYEEISSSLLPVYDGEYHSVMLRKSTINTNLFPTPSFETSSLANPPFITGTNSAEFGSIKIVSSSNVAKIGTKSLEHRNTHPVGGTSINGGLFTTSYTFLYRNSKNHPSLTASVTNVSPGDTYVFTAYAKVSSSVEDSVGSIGLFELNSNGDVVNWSHEDEGADPGGIKFSELVGLNETEWKQIQVKKTIKFPNTSGLGIRFDNNRAASTIFWDDVSIHKIDNPTDSIGSAFRYDLFVKKYDAGLDRIRLSSHSDKVITGSNAVSQSLIAAWTGSGDLFIGGNNTTPFGASKLTGSMMEFRLWSEPLDEESFNIHVSSPKSYVGNSPTSSFTTLVKRFSFDDDTVLASSASIRDTRPDQTTTQSGSANHFGGANTFESVIDKTKTFVPNSGPNRRMATKIRIEDNYLSGSGANLQIDKRYDRSVNDYAPLDSPKLGVYFSPTDVVNEDIVSSFANLDFNNLLGDPRDNFSENYRDLKDTSNTYFQKYTGKNNFWDYIHLIKYYDQSIFKQLRKVVPARAKTNMGTLIEGNIFERPKSPVQKSNPSITQPNYDDTINISNFDVEHEDSRSVVLPKGSYPNYEGTSNNREVFLEPSLYRLAADDNLEDKNTYISSSVTFGGPSSVFTEATCSFINTQRLSENNQEYRFFYTSSFDFDKSDKMSVRKDKNLYTSKSLVDSDRDPGYQDTLGLNRSFYEGVKNTKDTTIDGDSPIIVRVTSPTVAVPFDSSDSNLKVIEKTSGE